MGDQSGKPAANPGQCGRWSRQGSGRGSRSIRGSRAPLVRGCWLHLSEHAALPVGGRLAGMVGTRQSGWRKDVGRADVGLGTSLVGRPPSTHLGEAEPRGSRSRRSGLLETTLVRNAPIDRVLYQTSPGGRVGLLLLQVVQERRVDLGFLVAWIGIGRGMRSYVTPRRPEHWAARPQPCRCNHLLRGQGERPRPLPI